MILTLWTILLILSFLLLLIGYVFYETHVSDILIIVGWTFVFALGVILLSNAVEYKTGVNQTISYTYFEYDYLVNGENYTNILINTSSINEVSTYESFSSEGTGVLQRVANSHLWGFLLMLAGFFGAVLFWWDVKAYDREIDEDSIYNENN